ncbi:TetR/AcrR family transcriptional regulator [Nocardioides sp. T2.26MG-1]|uniref:TetR/AcrR family transcriptional regulator n=1 Tax=Nocardioides sp. T2.26MG-1 TaxID=3041166 RepID=UPI0025423801|nr:TetR family transcriptional regulator [Nocardioides sp. T2.26MG-1]
MPESGDHPDAGGTGARRRGRRSGHSESRESILAAARELFAERGYAGTTVRAIADRAGVDAALIAHFFGDKGGLFAAVAGLPARVPGDLLDALSPPEGAGARLASVYLTWWEDPETAAPLLATARSALVLGEAMDRLRGLLLSEVLSEAVPAEDRADRELRVALAMSHLLGVAMGRHVIRVPALVTPSLDELVAAVAPAIQGYLTGPAGLGSEQPSTLSANHPSAH